MIKIQENKTESMQGGKKNTETKKNIKNSWTKENEKVELMMFQLNCLTRTVLNKCVFKS